MKYLKKADALLVIDEKCDDVIPMLITHKNDGGNYYGEWLEFQPDLDEISIETSEDEWSYWGDMNRNELVDHLRSKGFEVILSEDY